MERVKKMIRYSGAVRAGVGGKGVSIAVLDSGIMPHPDLMERMAVFRDFTSLRKSSAYDDCGHGTHINGILAGNGSLSEGRLQGMAPQCRLINGKILDHKGEGDADSMLNALQWVLQLHKEQNIRILNLSVAVYQMEDVQKLKELSDMLDHLCERGILVVTAAGNRGPKPGSISGLAASSKVLTVGCHDYGYRDAKGKSCEMHSGRGTPGEVRKPDLVAPGTDISSCGFEYRRGKNIVWGYTAKTGTSMAVPIVSGAAALLTEKYPDMGVYMLKRKLQESTTDLYEAQIKQGYGMLNLEKMFYPVN